MAESTKQVRDILVQEGGFNAGGESEDGTSLRVGREPTSPGNVATLFDTPDRGPFLGTQKTDKTYEYDGVQLRVRNISYDKAMKIAKDAKNLLHGTSNQNVGSVFVTLIEALDNPFLLDWDDNNRARVVVNFAVQKQEGK